MKKDEYVSIDINYLTSDLTASLSLQNYDSHQLHFFELRTPFLMIVSTSNKKENYYSFYQFTFDGHFCHILNDQERDEFLNRPQHQHSFIEIMYVLSGEVTNYIEDKTFTYRAGDCVIMNRNIQHKEMGDYQVVFFDLQEDFINSLIDEEIATYKKTSRCYYDFVRSQIIKMMQDAHTDNSQYQKIYFDCLPGVDSDIVINQIFPLINTMIREFLSGNPGSVYIIKGYIQKFLSILCDPAQYNVSGISSTLSKQSFLMKKIEHILASNHGKISRNELARLFHYNEEYLNRIIKQNTGKTFSQYRQYIRLQEARRLLVDTDMSVSKIMELLELSNRSFFYQIFQKEFGVTPSEYRQNNRRS